MDITLVSAAGSEEVHGTDNDKKTGCGVNLLKPENVTRYRRIGRMTDLKEITCFKCKANLAKKMIKADKKEMARLLKEEKQREKMGIADEGIVPLGNTTAKITSSPSQREEAPASRQSAPVQQTPAYTEPEMTSEPIEDPAAAPKFIPGTGVAMDDDLAAFAISKPQEEEPEPVAEEDDFLAQFAIQKPQEEAEEVAAENEQDDFLARFAIPATGVQQTQAEPVYEEPDEMNELEIPEDISQTSIPAAHSAEPVPVQMQDDEDIMKMFSVEQDDAQNQTPAESVYENDESVIDIEDDEISPYEEPAYEEENTQAAPEAVNETAAAEETETDLSGVSAWDALANQLFGFEDVQDGPAEMAELSVPSAEAEIAPAEHNTVPEIEDIAPAPKQAEVIEEAEIEEVQPAAPVLDDIESAIAMAESAVKAPAPVQQTAPVIEEIAPAPQPVQQTAPVLDDIASAIAMAESAAKAPAPVQQTAPVIEEIAPAPQPVQQTAPVIEEIAPAPQPVQQTAPVIEEIAPAPQPVQQTAPVIEEIAPAPQPVQQTAPVIEEIAPAPQPVQQTAPVIEEIAPAPQPVQQTAPVIEEIAPAPQPVQQTAPVIEEIAPAPQPVQQTAPAAEEAAPAPQPVQQAAPVVDDIASAIAVAAAVPKAPAPAPVPIISNAPTAPSMSAAPVNTNAVPTAETNGDDDDMKKYSVPKYADELPKKPAQATQPQVINVPQFAGYDQNGQPIYSYVQMILTGYDQNGQPIFASIQGQNPAPAVPNVPQAAPAMPQGYPAMPNGMAVMPNGMPAMPGGMPGGMPGVMPGAVAGMPQPAEMNNIPVMNEPKRVSIAVAAALAAEEAAQANGPTANVSKIAVNPHSRSTSKAFINAISSSKDYADKNLIDTQGLRANSPVLNSVEDVLSSMGDDSLKRKRQAASQQAVPQFEEYKTPQRKTTYSSSPSPSVSKPQEKDPRFMTKAELKAKKKQDKIDAKFRKDMAKRGF